MPDKSDASATTELTIMSVPVPPAAAKDALARRLAVLALGVGLSALAIGSWPLFMPPPAPKPAASPQELTAVRNRVDALEQSLNCVKADLPPQASSPTPPDAASKDQVQAALAELSALREKLANLQQNIAGAEAVQHQLAQLKDDLAVANTAISGMRGHVQQMTSTAQQAAAAETTTRAQMVAYMQLRSAAAGAAPFTAELQALCDVTRNIAVLARECAKLDNSAHAGVATLPMLQSRFAVMSGVAEQAEALAAAKNWFDRMKVSFDALVRIRKIDESGAPDTSKLLHDASAALQRGNIAAALSLVESLPPAAQNELREWLPDARARLELEAALTRIGSALGQAQPTGEAPQP